MEVVQQIIPAHVSINQLTSCLSVMFLWKTPPKKRVKKRFSLGFELEELAAVRIEGTCTDSKILHL